MRTVGEQMYTQFGIGLARMARTIRERMNVRDNEVFTPIDLINAKSITSVINSFLEPMLCHSLWISKIHWQRSLTSDVCQRWVSGLSRERAGFEVRDVHYTTMAACVPLKHRKDRILV